MCVCVRGVKSFLLGGEVVLLVCCACCGCLERGGCVGQGLDVRAVRFVDVLHVLEACGLGDGEGVDLLGVLLYDGG